MAVQIGQYETEEINYFYKQKKKINKSFSFERIN